MKNSFHIGGGFKVFDGFGKVFVHCQILVAWFLQWLCWEGFFREGLVDTYGLMQYDVPLPNVKLSS